MDNTYSNTELRDMHYYYGVAGGNASAARRLYGEAFANRRIPQSRLFSTIHTRLGEFGSLKTKLFDVGRQRRTRTPQVEGRILESVENNPNLSVRQIAAQENISKSSVHEVLKEQLLHPYHYQKVQALSAEDPMKRLQMCNRIIDIHNADENFLGSILFTDEAGFGHDGLINLHNDHYWADENPYGIVGDHLIGPYFLPPRLNSDSYLDFLRNQLPILLEDVPLQVRNSMWLLQDGAPPHYGVAVRRFLNEAFPERWIGRAGFVEWASRSPDLNPMDFFFWGYLKSLVYRTPINSLQELRQRIIDNCAAIAQKDGIFFRVRRNFLRRLNLCIEEEGRHFENLL